MEPGYSLVTIGNPGNPGNPLLAARASEPTEQAVQQAALFIQDAYDGIERVHPQETPLARRAHLAHLLLRYPMRAVLLSLVFLSFFERPAWSVLHERFDEEPKFYPTLDLPMLNRWEAALLEAVFLLLLLGDLGLQMAYQSPQRYFGQQQQACYSLLLFGTIVDAVVASFTPWEAFRLAPYFRLSLLVLQSDNVRLQLALGARCLPALCSVLIVLVGFLVFCAWAGTLLFQKSTEGSNYFPSLAAGLWSLLVCITTANFPDVMMPAYEASRLSVVFFAFFLLLGNWFLLNLVLAVVYKAHEDSTKATAEAAAELRSRMLGQAFQLLDAASVGGLPMDVVRRVFNELNYYREIAYIDDERARLLFATLDASGDNIINEEEFGKLYALLKISFERVPKRTWVMRCCPKLAASRGFTVLATTVKSRTFDIVIDVVLVLNAVALILEQFKLLGLGPTPKTFDGVPDSVWNAIELAFGMVFTAEMLLKLMTYGWIEYWRDLKNTFDAAVTLATVVTIIIVYVPNEISDSRLIRVVLLVRLLRLLRLMASLDAVRFISATFVKMLPEAVKLLKVLFCLVYAFASLGVTLFGGLINTDPTGKQAAALADTVFGQSGYYPNSFNDLGSGFVTCFELLVVNNWFILADGYVAVSGPAARLFFIAFYICGVLICLNIVMAFAIAAFMETADQLTATRLAGAGTALGEAHFDAAQVTGTTTGLSGEWRAVASSGLAQQQLDVLRGVVEAQANGSPSSHPSGRHDSEGPPGRVGEGL